MTMNTRVVVAWLLIMFAMGSAHAGLFARGGGESRTISRVTPQTVYNNSSQRLTLVGHFSKQQGRDRRVVIYPDRLPTPFPVRVTHWSGGRIDIMLPAQLATGPYHVYLERNYPDHGSARWRDISNRMAFTVNSGEHVRSDGLPHAAPIRFRSRPFNCAAQPAINVVLLGGPFFQSGRPINNIRAELNVRGIPAPSVRVNSDTQVTASVSLCAFMQSAAGIRLVYPDRSTSNWLPLDGSGRALLR